MIFSITNPTELVDWLQIFCKSGWLSPWDSPLQWGKIHEEFTAPQHTRFILPPFHPDKIHRCAAWAVFFFMGTCRGKAPPSCCARPFRCLKAPLGLSLLRYACKRKPHLENFMSQPNVIPTFQPTPLQNRGRNCVRSKRWPPYMSSTTSTYFFRLNNSETFVESWFWAQR